eukprot:3012188-Lingulodinium_polyedra.AAC.2
MDTPQSGFPLIHLDMSCGCAAAPKRASKSTSWYPMGNMASSYPRTFKNARMKQAFRPVTP